MAALDIQLDPTAEATGTQLDIVDNSTYFLLEHSHDPPGLKAQYASSADTEGDIPIDVKYENRKVRDKIRIRAATDALVQTALNNLFEKIGKFQREGGTYKLTLPSGDAFIFDVLPESTGVLQIDRGFIKGARVDVDLEFTCLPFARAAAEVSLTDHTETTLPCIVATDTGVKGDVPGIGRLVIDEDDAEDQWWAIWGVQSRHYSADASAALYYEAEGRTAQGGSATAAGPTGASGAGSNVMRNTGLTTSYQSILSTQATGAGAHLSHIGDFRVFARFQTPTTNTGGVTVALEWAEGDFRSWNRNSEVDLFPSASAYGVWEGTWRLIDLGQVHLTKVVSGTQRWEGRILAKSTVAGDDIDVDYLMLVPVTEGSGEVSGIPQLNAPTAFTARDEFDQTAGALAGKTLPSGGTWAGAGDATDFNVDGSGSVTRTATGDGANIAHDGRMMTASTGTTSNYAAVDFEFDTAGTAFVCGVLLRMGATVTSDYLACFVNPNSGVVEVYKRVSAGTVAALGYYDRDNLAINQTYTISALVDTYGRLYVWLYKAGATPGAPVIETFDSDLSSSGALATGKVGFFDWKLSATACTRTYDNFRAAVPAYDAAIFASQSLEIRNDRVVREDSGGTLWVTPSKYEGSYLRVPPQGQESRTLRAIVKACRNDPVTMADPGIDDISYRIHYKPRYLNVPEA